MLGGFRPINLISGEDIIFLSSFHNNDVTLSQFSAYIVLLQSFINSLTIVLPFYPVGTMERVVEEGIFLCLTDDFVVLTIENFTHI